MERSPSPDLSAAISSRRKKQRPLSALACALALTMPLHIFAQTDPIESRLPFGTHPILQAIPETGIPISGRPLALRGNVPPRARLAADLGPVSPDTSLAVTFHLNRHNRKGMDDLVKRIYTPGDSLYHRFLSVDERTNLFAPSSQEALTVARYAQAQGFIVVDIAPDRSTVQVSGKVSQIHKAFGVNLRKYHDRAAFHGDFFAPDRDPQIPESVVKLLSGIDGLTDANRPRPSLKSDPSSWWPFSKGFPAAFIRTVYGLNGLKLNGTPLNGKGQTVALVEFGDLDTTNLDGYIAYNAKGYDPTDGISNGTQISLKKPSIVKIGSAPLNDVQGEAELDLNMLVALADGLSTIYVYEGNDVATVFNKVKNDNKTKIVSYSYGSKEIHYGASSLESLNTIFEEMALQGQNVFASSGDQGDYIPDDPHGTPHSYEKTVEVPADSPYVTGVGGTLIGFNAMTYGWSSETTWNNNANSATGGGVSTHFPIPWYQQDYLGINPGSINSDMLGTNAMSHYRSVPDVALNARHFYSYSKGSGGPVGGTSASAPLWAAFTALVNQGRAILGEDSIGFLNPVLYRLASNSTTYAKDFHDISDYSNNANYVTTDGYQAVAGYDAATGLGSFVGKNLLSDLLLADHAWSIGLKASTPSIPLTSSIEVGSGTDINFTATLSQAAPVETTVGLYGSGKDHTYYGKITIPANQLSGSTTVTAPYVKIKNKLSIQGTYSLGGFQPIVSVTVDPLTVASFTFPAGSFYSGNPGDTIVGTITLNGVAPKDEVLSVQLKSPNYDVTFPKTITIEKGSSTGKVAIQANNGSVGVEQQIQVWVNTLGSDIVRNIYKANLALEPAPIVTGVTITPRDPNGPANAGKVLSGLSAVGTVTLQSPALGLGATMMVPSSYSGVHPVTFMVAPGETTASFTINTDQSLTDYTAQMVVETTYNTPASAKQFSLLVQGHEPFIQTTTSVTSTSPTAVAGSPVTITATVSATKGVATGSVYFSVPGVNVPLDGTGTARIVMPTELSLPAGTYKFKVSYAGDGVYQPSSGSVTQVLLPPTTVKLTANPTTAVQTQTIYYVAGIPSKPGLPIPTGTITFVDQGAGPGNYVTLGTQTLDNAGLAFFADNSLLPFQTHLIVANYSGDANYPAGFTATPINITINPCTITGKLVSSLNPSPIGQPITYTASFTVPANAALPVGTVLLVDNDNIIDQQPITEANKGVVAFKTSGQFAGTHFMQAQFIGNAPGLVSSGEMTQTIAGNVGPTTFSETVTLTKGSYVRAINANVVLKNVGANPAGSVRITSASLGSTSSVTVLPMELGTLSPGASNSFTLQFNQVSAGFKVFTLNGTYDDGSAAGGKFTLTVRVRVP